MKLIGFSIAEDFITVECGPDRFDLHNDFDFQRLTYNPIQRTLDLQWRRRLDDRTKAPEPAGLLISFSGVYMFKAKERDLSLPFSEDNCLDSVGFMWDDLVAEMGAFTSNKPGVGCNHLTANFMSGFSIKIGAESVALGFTGGV